MVPSDSGILTEYPRVTGTPRGNMGLSGERGGRTPNPLSNLDWSWGGTPPLGCCLSFPLRPTKAHQLPGGFR